MSACKRHQWAYSVSPWCYVGTCICHKCLSLHSSLHSYLRPRFIWYATLYLPRQRPIETISIKMLRYWLWYQSDKPLSLSQIIEKRNKGPLWKKRKNITLSIRTDRPEQPVETQIRRRRTRRLIRICTVCCSSRSFQTQYLFRFKGM